MNRNKGSVVKQSGTDIESFQYSTFVFFSICASKYENECKLTESRTIKITCKMELLPHCVLFSRLKLIRAQNNKPGKFHEFCGGRHCFNHCSWPLIKESAFHWFIQERITSLLVYIMFSFVLITIARSPKLFSTSPRVSVRSQKSARNDVSNYPAEMYNRMPSHPSIFHVPLPEIMNYQKAWSV